MPPPSYLTANTAGRVKDMPGGLPFGELKHGREGAHALWGAGFGNNVQMNTEHGYARYDRSMITQPEAFVGVQEILSDTITVMTLSDDNFYLKKISPWRVVENIGSLTWNKTIFKPGLATEVPHLGVVRLVKSERESFTASWIRYGIGYYMEHEFMNTREGIRYHLAHLEQMSNASLETAKFDVIYTLLEAHSFEKRYVIEKGLYKGMSPEKYMRDQAWMFASLQKEEYAINKLDSDVSQKMARWRGVANTWLMPPEIIRYLSEVPREYLSYSEAGPAGPERIRDGPAAFGVLNQSQVYITRAFYTNPLTGGDSLLEHTTEFGEYYRMSDTEYDPDVPYRSAHRNIQIYNFDSDGMHEVSLRFALDNCGLFNRVTGEPLRLNQVEAGRFNNRFEGTEKERDIFRYAEEQNGVYTFHEAQYMGEQELFYYSPRQKVQWAESVVEALRSRIGREKGWANVEEALQRGMELFNRIESLPYTPDFETEIIDRFTREAAAGPAVEARIGARAVVPVPRGSSSVQAAYHKQEYEQDPVTGFLKETGNQQPLNQLLPGLQSYAGMRYIAERAGAELVTEKKIAQNFVGAIRQVVSRLKALAPGAVFLNREYSSPWWHYATDETTFFENLVQPGYRPPMFLSTDAAAELEEANKDGLSILLTNVLTGLMTDAAAFDVENVVGQVAGDPLRGRKAYLIASILRLSGLTEYNAGAFAKLAAVFNIADPGRDATFAVDLNAWGGETEESVRRAFRAALTRLSQPNELPQQFVHFQNSDAVAIVDNEVNGLYDTQLRALSTDKGNRVAVIYNATSYHRLPLLASETFAASLLDHVVNNGSMQPTRLTIADPDFPEIAIQPEKLDRYTRHIPTRTQDVTPAERQAAAHPDNLKLLPTWRGIGADSVHTNTLFVNAMSAHIGHSLSETELDTRGSSRFSRYADEEAIDSQMQIGVVKGGSYPKSRTAAVVERTRSTLGGGLAGLRESQRNPISPVVGRLMDIGGRFLSKNFARSWEAINQEAASPLVRALAHLYDSIPISYQAYSSFIDNNVRLPLDFYVTRPHINFTMLMAIKLWAGAETMFTAVQPGLFEMEDDAKTQAHLGTFTWKHKCIVKEPANVYIAKGVFANGVNGGLGVNVIDVETYNAGNGTYDNESIIVLAVSPNDVLEGNLLSLTGYLTVAEFDSLGLTSNNSVQYETAARYNKLYGWNESRVGVNYDTTPHDAILERDFNNVLCMPGLYLKKTLKDNTYTTLVRGQGHLAGMIYPGCAAVLEGRMTRVDPQPWASYIQA